MERRDRRSKARRYVYRPPDLASGPDAPRAGRRDSGDAELGSVRRPGSDAPLQQALHSVELARLVGLRYRRAGRHGMSYPAPRIQGPAARIPLEGSGQFDRAAHGLRAERPDGEVRLPGPAQKRQGRHARSRGLLVRRRHHARSSRRHARRQVAERSGRRSHLLWNERHADMRLLRRESLARVGS